MSKPSVLDQKIAEIKAKRDAAALQVAMLDQVLELLVTPVPGETEREAPKPRAPRGSVTAVVANTLQIRGALRLDELEKFIPGSPRSSIRKALAALLRDSKVHEDSTGLWSLRASAPESPVVHLHRVADAEDDRAFDDASVREE